jgi:D-alanine-D-alanine ligase
MALGCRDVARVDLRLTPEGRAYIIEVNPLPGLTPNYSDLCLIANGTGIEYRTLIGEILSGAIKRSQARQRAGERGERVERGEGVDDHASRLAIVSVGDQVRDDVV